MEARARAKGVSRGKSHSLSWTEQERDMMEAL